MPKKSPAIRTFQAQRIRYEISRTFDQVLSDLRRLVGDATAGVVNDPDARNATQEDFERRMQALAGASGFMLFFEINHGDWLPIYGVRRKVTRWIFGNPVIAYTMIRHDITAGLFAPVEMLLFENELDDGSTLIYDLPSSLMVLDDNPVLLNAAEALDRKLAELVERVAQER
jgi:hypothetical protein